MVHFFASRPLKIAGLVKTRLKIAARGVIIKVYVAFVSY